MTIQWYRYSLSAQNPSQGPSTFPREQPQTLTTSNVSTSSKPQVSSSPFPQMSSGNPSNRPSPELATFPGFEQYPMRQSFSQTPGFTPQANTPAPMLSYAFDVSPEQFNDGDDYLSSKGGSNVGKPNDASQESSRYPGGTAQSLERHRLDTEELALQLFNTEDDDTAASVFRDTRTISAVYDMKRPSFDKRFVYDNLPSPNKDGTIGHTRVASIQHSTSPGPMYMSGMGQISGPSSIPGIMMPSVLSQPMMQPSPLSQPPLQAQIQPLQSSIQQQPLRSIQPIGQPIQQPWAYDQFNQLQMSHAQQLQELQMQQQMQQMQMQQQMLQLQMLQGNPIAQTMNQFRNQVSSPMSTMSPPNLITSPPGHFGRGRDASVSDDSHSAPTPGSFSVGTSPAHLSPFNQTSPGSLATSSLSHSPGSSRAGKRKSRHDRSNTGATSSSTRSPNMSAMYLESPDPSSRTVDKKASGKRRYVCNHDGCGKAFSSSGHLSRHIRIHLAAELAQAALGAAGGDITVPTPIPDMNGTVVDVDGTIKFPCPWQGCASLFGRKDNLRSHFKTHVATADLGSEAAREEVLEEGLNKIGLMKEVRVAIENGIGRVVMGDDSDDEKPKKKKREKGAPEILVHGTSPNSPPNRGDVPEIRMVPPTPNSIAITASQSSMGSQMLPGPSSTTSIGKGVQPEKLMTDLKNEYQGILNSIQGVDVTSMQPTKAPISPKDEASALLQKISELQRKLQHASTQLETNNQPVMNVSPSGGQILAQGRLESLMEMAKLGGGPSLRDFSGISTASVGAVSAANLLVGLNHEDMSPTALASPTTQQMAQFLSSLQTTQKPSSPNGKSMLTPDNWFGQI